MSHPKGKPGRRGGPHRRKTTGLVGSCRWLFRQVVVGVVVGVAVALIGLCIEYKSGHFANAGSTPAPPQVTSSSPSYPQGTNLPGPQPAQLEAVICELRDQAKRRAAEEQERSEGFARDLASAREQLAQTRREAAEAVRCAAGAGQRVELLERRNSEVERELAEARRSPSGQERQRSAAGSRAPGDAQETGPAALACIVYYRCPSQQVKQFVTEEARELSALMSRLGIRVVWGKEYFPRRSRGYTAVAYGPRQSWGQWRGDNEKQALAMQTRLRAYGLQAQLEPPEDLARELR